MGRILTIVDYHRRCLWIILLKSKSEVSVHVQNFIIIVEIRYHITLKVIRIDNCPEFLLPNFYASKDISYHRYCCETPQHNDIVNRKHQLILNIGIALLYQSKFPTSFWSYVVLHVIFLMNRVTTPILENKILVYMLHDKPPDMSTFKVFNHLCYASTIQTHITKLQLRAIKSIFLGYKADFKGYVLFDLHTKEIFISRHVTFHEHVLPYKGNPSSCTHYWEYFESLSVSSIHATTPSHFDPLIVNYYNQIPITAINTDTSSTDIHPSPIISPHINLRKSFRTKTLPLYLQDYIVLFILHHPIIHVICLTIFLVIIYLTIIVGLFCL